MNRYRKTVLTAVLGFLLMAPATSFPQAPAQDEEFKYRWQLRNFIGSLAGLFLPNQGEGLLTFKSDRSGRLRSELTITSDTTKNGEYFRYGSEIDTRTLQPVRAWSAYSWRGETKSKSSEIEQDGVLDIASGIYSIRLDPPTKSRRMEIWSDGKVYPVVVIPLGAETRKLGAGKKIATNHFSIRGVDIPGRRKWKGKMDLWLTRDEAATPVEIMISRNLADVHMELQSLP